MARQRSDSDTSGVSHGRDRAAQGAAADDVHWGMPRLRHAPGQSRSAQQRIAPLIALTLLLSSTFSLAQGVDPVLDRPEAAGGTVALILAGGAARGAAHVGVIRALTEAGVPIDMIVATSMGALIGGLYASGFDVDALAEVVEVVDPNASAELLLPPRGGVLDLAPLAIVLDHLLEGRRLSETRIAFHPVLADLLTGDAVPAPDAPLADVIRAAVALPVVFDPFEIDGRYYYDGGLKQMIPASLARELGADYIIAVSIPRDSPYDPRNVQANLSRVFISVVDDYTQRELPGTDAIIDPDLRLASYMDFDLSAGFAAAGEAAARAELGRIVADLEALGIPLVEAGDPNRGDPINADWRARLEAGQREVALRPRPWNVAIDLGLSPAAAGERVTPAPSDIGDRLRFGVDLRDGFLGRGSVGASYGRSLTGGSDALELRAGYRLSYPLAVYGRGEIVFDSGWDARFGVRWFVTSDLELGAAYRVPADAIEASLRWRPRGVWVDADAAAALDGDWARYALDVRAAVTSDAPFWSAFALRGRVFAGATAGPEVPELERFSVGPAVGLRGVRPDAWSADALVVANLDLAYRLVERQAVVELALIEPWAWVFADGARFTSGGEATTAWSLGVGAGLEGSLFGFVPFSFGVDVGHSPSAGSWYLGLHAAPRYPVAWAW